MKGDIIVVEEHNLKVARKIVPHLIEKIKQKEGRYTISVAGESGSGKSTTGKAIAVELAKIGIHCVLLGQDDYFVLPPKFNDAKRRENSEWLGPHVEVNMELLDQNLKDAINGVNQIVKPLIDYHQNSVEDEIIDLQGIKVVIAEGTYASLLKHVDTRIFMASTRVDTLVYREKRNRGNEVGDPFIEQVLMTEHKIIAGHKQLADFVVTNTYEVIVK